MIETTSAEHPISSRGGHATKARLRPKFWRVAAALTATAVCAILFVVGPGSVELVTHAPVSGAHAGQTAASWIRPCFAQQRAFRNGELAFCARVSGRILGSQTMGGEPHLFVSGAFHFTLVELRSGSPVPPWGSYITAIGPLVRGEYGLRELKAQWTSAQ